MSFILYTGSSTIRGIVKSTNGLNIRNAANSTAAILTSAPNNDFVTIIDTNGPSESISGVILFGDLLLLMQIAFPSIPL
jgi:hypothetical protein